MTIRHRLPLGATLHADNTATFRVWAPDAQQIELNHLRHKTLYPMQRDEAGYYTATITDAQAGDRYWYRMDGEKDRPDMASCSQPDGVHQASQLVNRHYDWQDANWLPPTLQNSVMYELHVGTFTPEGTFEAIIPHLERLRTLGITTLQLMPVAQFPGERNWGYDGVSLYAPHHAYGGVVGFKRFVDAAHRAGIAVFLDVVYNHLGPEGNYLWDYGPYFTDRYHSPWSSSINFDGPHSDEVRRFFIENALYWLDEYHIDGLRLDATHALLDFSAVPFLDELTAGVHAWATQHNRRVYLIAENDRSNRKLLLPPQAGGTGLDGQWLDDFHHAVHNALTGETDGYYADYGDFDLFLKVLREGYAYSGQYSPYRQRRHGTSSADIPADRFVVAIQTHDQVGNRMLGERLAALVDFDSLKLAAGTLLTSPYVPMLFMGQEYAETAPFLYFVSHSDENLIKGVREGRIEEFKSFAWRGTPPDPNATETFERSKLNHELRHDKHHRILYDFYAALLNLRQQKPALTNPARQQTRVSGDAETRLIVMHRTDGDHYAKSAIMIIFNYHLNEQQALSHRGDGQSWRKLFDSSEADWQPDEQPLATAPALLTADDNTPVMLPPKSFVIYEPLA